jgi:nicotinamidase-related amidase
MINKNLQRLKLEEALLLVVDVQAKLAGLMHDADRLIHQLGILIDACKILQVPIVWAEQLPEKLGSTLPALAEKLTGVSAIPKSSFGCCGDQRLSQAIVGHGRSQIILCGIEAHVCIWQTATELLEQGYHVHLACDAVSSRSPENRQIALQRMQAAGAQLSNVEMAIFELMQNAHHPCFREVVKLFK